jgi:X-X-X-Leu-X-X-Gly heptad repeat protein
MMDGKPGSILYALAYFQQAINGQVIPGVTKLMDGTSKIGDGSGQAKTAIASGLVKIESSPAIMSALQDNVAQNDSFLGKPEGAAGMVAYIYQTPAVSQTATVMNYGLGVIALALIVLFAIGRPPKQTAQFTTQEASEM